MLASKGYASSNRHTCCLLVKGKQRQTKRMILTCTERPSFMYRDSKWVLPTETSPTRTTCRHRRPKWQMLTTPQQNSQAPEDMLKFGCRPRHLLGISGWPPMFSPNRRYQDYMSCSHAVAFLISYHALKATRSAKTGSHRISCALSGAALHRQS